MVASVLTDWTILINESSTITQTATLPTAPAGSNRIWEFMCIMYSGSGTVTPPNACTANGQSAALVLTDVAAQTRIGMSLFQFVESQISAINGQTLTTSGGSAASGSKTVLYRILQDAKQSLPAATGQAYNASNATQTIPLARLENSFTTGMSFTSVGATSLTQTNPARTSTVTLTSTRRMSYGILNDTANTSNFVVNGQGFTTSFVTNREAAPTQTVVNINGGTDIPIGQSGVTASLTGFTGLPVVTSNSQHAITSAGGTANAPIFNLADRIEGALGDSLPFEANFTFTNDAEVASASETINYKTTEVKIVFTAPIKTNQTYLPYPMEANGHDTDNAEIYYIPYEDLVVDTTGKVTVTNPGTFTLWLRPTEGPTAGRTYFYDVTVASGGAVVSANGLTRAGLTTSGLTSAGLTRAGL